HFVWSQHHQKDCAIEALASLVFHTQTWEKGLTSEESSQGMIFSDEEVAQLWSKIPATEEAYHYYYQARELMLQGEREQAQGCVKRASHLLLTLWEQMTDADDLSIEVTSCLRHRDDLNFEHNAAIPSAIKKKMRPYLIPAHHPMKSSLDDIFLHSR